MTVVQQPIENRGGDHGIAKHLIPVADRLVAREQHAPAFIAFGDHLKQQMGGMGGCGQVAELVDLC